MRNAEQEVQWQAKRKALATLVGVTFHRAMREARTILYSGATGRAWQDIGEIDPKVWESICYKVADAVLADPKIYVKDKYQGHTPPGYVKVLRK